MKTFKAFVTFFIAIIFFNQKMYAQQGTLDLTFGDSGTVVVEKPFFAGRSLIQPDSKIVLLSVGSVLDRFNPDGSSDPTFGKNGRITLNFNHKLFSNNCSFALQSDGKIVCIGDYNEEFGITYSGVFRCNPNGSIDSSFGINGMDTVHINNLNYGTGIVIQPDGKIVVSGDVLRSEYEDTKTFIYRLMPNGGLDSTFGKGGIVVNNHISNINSRALILRPNGKLIIGSLYNFLDSHPIYQLESFNNDGSADKSFGDNGIAKFTFGDGVAGSWYTQFYDMALQNDGKIVCVGRSGNKERFMSLCRFNEDGTIDASFGENGSIITYMDNVAETDIYGLCFQPDGKIITCGSAAIAYTFGEILICRYTANGQIDPEFGTNGFTTITKDSSYVGINSIHYLSDGKIFGTGQLTHYFPSTTAILMVRLNGGNVLAANFKEVKAVANKDAITITWQTLNESGAKSYTVERSGNANIYVGINTVPAKGAASIYNYTDKNPLNGNNYYRIRENAINGTNTFSPVVKVMFNSTGIISLYPNPAKNTVTVKGLNKNITAIIKITDMQGREISSQNFNQTNTAILNIRSLSQGTYFVQIAQEDKIVRLKLIKE